MAALLPFSAASISFQAINDSAIADATVAIKMLERLDPMKRDSAKIYSGFASQINHSNTPPPKNEMAPINSAEKEPSVFCPS